MFVKKLRQLFGGQPEAAAPVQADYAAPQAVIIPDNAPYGLVAAIAAAIASVWTGPTGFVVRRIRRIPKAGSRN